MLQIATLFSGLRALHLSKCDIFDWEPFDKKRQHTEAKFKFLQLKAFTIKSLKSDLNVLEWIPEELEELSVQDFDYYRGEYGHFSYIFRLISSLATFSQLKRLALDCSIVTEEYLLHLPHSLTALTLSLSTVSEIGADALEKLTGLQSLVLTIRDRMPRVVSLLPSNTTGLEFCPWNLGDESLELGHLTRLRTLRTFGKHPAIKGRSLNTLSQQLMELDLQSCHLTDDHFAYLAGFSQLTKLNITRNKRITGSYFYALSSSLMELVVSKCDIADENLAQLAHCSKLEKFTIFENKRITGAFFHRLPKSLVTLNANYCRINEGHLIGLAALTRLSNFNLSGSRISGTSLQYLPLSLTHAVYSSCAITAEAINHFARLVLLQRLDLAFNKKIGGARFESLPTSLTEICFSSCGKKLTDKDIDSLSHLTLLKRLHLCMQKRCMEPRFSICRHPW